MATLDQLRPGEQARVDRIAAGGVLAQRLAELGVLEGALVRMVRVAPLGDPLEFELDGCYLSLRKADARGVVLRDV